MRQIAVRLSSRGRSLLAALVEIGGNRWEQVDVYKVSWRCPVTRKNFYSFVTKFLKTLFYKFPLLKMHLFTHLLKAKETSISVLTSLKGMTLFITNASQIKLIIVLKPVDFSQRL